VAIAGAILKCAEELHTSTHYISNGAQGVVITCMDFLFIPKLEVQLCYKESEYVASSNCCN